MADPPEYFYHVSNRKEMSHAKILLLNTFTFCEQPLTLLGKASVSVFTFHEPNNILGNYRSSRPTCGATQQLKPNPTFSVLLFHHLLPVWDTNKAGGQWIKSELAVWADILPSSDKNSLKKNPKDQKKISLYPGKNNYPGLTVDGAWEQKSFPWSAYPHTAAMQLCSTCAPTTNPFMNWC